MAEDIDDIITEEFGDKATIHGPETPEEELPGGENIYKKPEEAGKELSEEEKAAAEKAAEEGAGDKTEEEKAAEKKAEEEKAEEDAKKAAATVDELGVINTFTGGEYKTVDEARDDRKSRIASSEEKDKELASLTEENKKLADAYDPMSHFVNKEEYIRQQLMKKFPDYDPAVLSQIVGIDMSKLSDVQVLTYELKLEHGAAVDQPGKVSSQDILNDKYGIDPDDEEGPSVLAKGKMEIDANLARKKLLGLSKEVEIPNMDEIQAKKQEAIESATKAWGPVIKDELAKSLNKVTFTQRGPDGKFEEFFSFEIDQKYRDAIASKADAIVKDLSVRGVEITDQVKAGIFRSFQDRYVLDNLPKILKSHTSKAVAEMDEKTFAEIHNPDKDKKSKSTEKKEKTSAEKSKEEAETEIEKDD